MSDPEGIAGMEMPCMCNCGEFFDLHDGNTCRGCHAVFCVGCVEGPFELCPLCDYEDNDDEQE